MHTTKKLLSTLCSPAFEGSTWNTYWECKLSLILDYWSNSGMLYRVYGCQCPI